MKINYLLSLGVCAWLVVNGVELKGNPAQQQKPMPESVNVAEVIKLESREPNKYAGIIEAFETVNVIPRVTGIIEKVNFTEGDLVKEGDLLFEIEDTTYNVAVAVAEARVDQIKADLKYYNTELERNQELIKDSVVSESVLDNAERSVANAKAQLAEAIALLVDAKNNQSYTKIYSPINGRIGKTKFTKGNLVTPNTGVIADIEMVSPIQVRFSLSERIFRTDFGGVNKFKDLADIKVILADGTLHNEKATIGLIDNKIDTNTNTITIWANFDNKNSSLIAGGYVTVLLAPKTDKPIPAVLSSAIQFGNGRTFVYVVDKDNKAIARMVELGGVTGNYQEILSGLEIGETVIVDGTHKVRPNAVVNPVVLK